MAARTQLAPYAITGGRYGSFAGKEAADEPAGPHNPGTLTQLAPYAITGGRHTFVAKGATEEPVQPTQTLVVTGGGAFESWEDYVKAVAERNNVVKVLRKKKEELKKVEKKIKAAKAVKHPEGILANLLQLEFRRNDLKTEIHSKESDLISMEWMIQAFEEIDDDDEEVLTILQ